MLDVRSPCLRKKHDLIPYLTGHHMGRHTHSFKERPLCCWLWPPDLWRSIVHCYVRIQDMWKWRAQYTAFPCEQVM